MPPPLPLVRFPYGDGSLRAVAALASMLLSSFAAARVGAVAAADAGGAAPEEEKEEEKRRGPAMLEADANDTPAASREAEGSGAAAAVI